MLDQTERESVEADLGGIPEDLYDKEARTYHLVKISEEKGKVKVGILSSPNSDFLRGTEIIISRDDYRGMIYPFRTKAQGLSSIERDTDLSNEDIRRFGNRIREYNPSFLKALIDDKNDCS